jgi:hypothetical protein
MVAAMPVVHGDDTEFDLDVRLEAVSRQVSADSALKPSEQGCPDYPVTEVSCVSCKPPCLE